MIYFDELLKKARVLDPPKPKVLAVGGSPRGGGNTDLLIKQITSGLKDEQIGFENVNLRDLEFKGCVGCEKCRKDKICTKINDGMSTLYPDIIESQGLILASPVHNYNITSWMKAFIDRMYCFYEFDNNTRPRAWSSRLANQNRKVIIVAVCEQAQMEDMGFAMEAMQRPLEALGFEVVGTLPVLLSFEKGAIKRQTEIMDQAYVLGKKLGQALKNN
jgi:multimeric flavodoxin WrbA